VALIVLGVPSFPAAVIPCWLCGSHDVDVRYYSGEIANEMKEFMSEFAVAAVRSATTQTMRGLMHMVASIKCDDCGLIQHVFDAIEFDYHMVNVGRG